jgi:hypothetical protein
MAAVGSGVAVHVTSDRMADECAQGLETSVEASASDVLQDRIHISLRPIGAPMAIGVYALGAASLVLAGLQVGWRLSS